MARGKPVEIRTRTFENQKVATAYFKEILNRYQPGEQLSNDDALDVSALLERHPNFVSKIGCGVDYFQVIGTEHGTNCFCIVRTDGSTTDFSYPRCITGRPSTKKDLVSRAFRSVVQVDLFNAKDKFFQANRDGEGYVTCAVSGQQITHTDAHIDHRQPLVFEVIVATFLSSRRMDYESVKILSGADGQVTPEIADAELARDFRAYHKDIAKLDVVAKGVNLSLSAKHRIRPARISLT